jgi:NAD(P)-dependent dehydrogenase (short-subunit alcohol dehydrogenase family)
MKLAGTVAVVTGGGSGIGAAICRAFASEGAKVAVAGLRPSSAEDVARSIGDSAKAYSLDVSDSASVESAADQIESVLGHIDVWVNSAGVSWVVPFLECSEDVWNTTVSVNLTGSFICCQAAIRRMLPRRTGSIINLSSQSGKQGASHQNAYSASKFGVIGLTQSLALEFAPQGIRVNAICPGVAFTPMWDGMLQDYARKRNIAPEDVRPYLESKIPLGRLCAPEDVAAAAVFLACDESSYMTGQAINVSGGAVM